MLICIESNDQVRKQPSQKPGKRQAATATGNNHQQAAAHSPHAMAQKPAREATKQPSSQAAKQLVACPRATAAGPHTRSSSWQLGELAAKN